jgi:hypothetical protein
MPAFTGAYPAAFSRKKAFSSASSSSRVTIALGKKGHYALVRWSGTRTGGAAATHQPFLTTNTADTNVSAPAQGRVATEAATAVATQINTVPEQPIVFYTDDGNVYFNPGFSSGSDNAGTYEVFFVCLGGSQESD